MNKFKSFSVQLFFQEWTDSQIYGYMMVQMCIYMVQTWREYDSVNVYDGVVLQK